MEARVEVAGEDPFVVLTEGVLLDDVYLWSASQKGLGRQGNIPFVKAAYANDIVMGSPNI